MQMYHRIGKYVYYEPLNAIGLISLCGEYKLGIDGYYIEWYA